MQRLATLFSDGLVTEVLRGTFFPEEVIKKTCLAYEMQGLEQDLNKRIKKKQKKQRSCSMQVRQSLNQSIVHSFGSLNSFVPAEHC